MFHAEDIYPETRQEKHLDSTLHEAVRQLRDHRKRDDAHMRAAKQAASLVQTIRAHIHNQNYGLAADWCEELLKNLPHDHGAQTFYPLLDAQLEEK